MPAETRAELFKQIDQSILIDSEGWCSREKARVLATLVLAYEPEVAVEIGVYTGKSAIPIALAMKFNGEGTLAVIDPWNADTSAQQYEAKHKEWWDKIDYGDAYKRFVDNATYFGVWDQMLVFKLGSDQVNPPACIGLLHVDGIHAAQAITDVFRFAPNVVRGGFVVLDDLDWETDGKKHVREAEKWLLSIGFIELFKIGTGAVYQRT
jgi:hypothetical protein